MCHCEELATWQSTQSDCRSRWRSLAMTNGKFMSRKNYLFRCAHYILCGYIFKVKLPNPHKPPEYHSGEPESIH
jgi:hypothetical protein